jgi:hypothetical protein
MIILGFAVQNVVYGSNSSSTNSTNDIVKNISALNEGASFGVNQSVQTQEYLRSGI